MSKKWLRWIHKNVVYLLLLLLPTQLAFHFWPSWAFVYGIRVDYLAPTIYLTDILALILVLTNLKILRGYLKYFLALVIFAAINIIFSTSPPESIYKWLKIFEMVFLGIYFFKSEIQTEKIFTILFYSAIFFSVIGILQFMFSKSLGGLLYFLGERNFNLLTSGIALVNIFGRGLLRAYSTFPHPNSLAGYLGVILILSFGFGKKSLLTVAGLLIVLLGFVLSFSLTASVALLLIIVIRFAIMDKDLFKRMAFAIFYLSLFASLILPFFSEKLLLLAKGLGQSTTQRLDFSFLAGKMISEKFILGQGLNTFIVNIPRFKGILSYSWVLQPVHNVPLLVLAETGVVGLILLFWLFSKALGSSIKLGNKNLALVILFIVCTWTLDHYWFTLQQNMLLVSILLGLSIKMTSWRKTS